MLALAGTGTTTTTTLHYTTTASWHNRRIANFGGASLRYYTTARPAQGCRLREICDDAARQSEALPTDTQVQRVLYCAVHMGRHCT